MNTSYDDQTVRTKEQEAVADAAERRTLESISIPVGTFAGSEDRIVRIRKGQIVPADTGDQGEGKTDVSKSLNPLWSAPTRAY